MHLIGVVGSAGVMREGSKVKVKAAILREMGATAPYATSRPLSIEEVELDAPGFGEVLVRIAAAGLCHSDLSVINGSRPRPMPMAIGHAAQFKPVGGSKIKADLRLGTSPMGFTPAIAATASAQAPAALISTRASYW